MPIDLLISARVHGPFDVYHSGRRIVVFAVITATVKILSAIPAAMQLRYLQTLTVIGAEQNSAIVFPMPIDIIEPFLELFEKSAKPVGIAASGGARGPLGAKS